MYFFKEAGCRSVGHGQQTTLNILVTSCWSNGSNKPRQTQQKSQGQTLKMTEWLYAWSTNKLVIAPAIPHNAALGYKCQGTRQETCHQMLPGVSFHSSRVNEAHMNNNQHTHKATFVRRVGKSFNPLGLWLFIQSRFLFLLFFSYYHLSSFSVLTSVRVLWHLRPLLSW